MTSPHCCWGCAPPLCAMTINRMVSGPFDVCLHGHPSDIVGNVMLQGSQTPDFWAIPWLQNDTTTTICGNVKICSHTLQRVLLLMVMLIFSSKATKKMIIVVRKETPNIFETVFCFCIESFVKHTYKLIYKIKWNYWCLWENTQGTKMIIKKFLLAKMYTIIIWKSNHWNCIMRNIKNAPFVRHTCLWYVRPSDTRLIKINMIKWSNAGFTYRICNACQ